uniref:AlNc14C177G8152 protein n=1 Tax=Albugo laibachii Nc14 TaxID=890382 RepID=F0WNZ9_9STRA|nr:AlNc14C177G8152 [Albugo laibachii Nc14]|eukprot:CCA23042.1 AlNc14C177G8152 [Albugo laibachii Nc14]
MTEINWTHSNFILLSQIQHKIFVGDTYSTQLHTTRNRNGGVMTILHSDFPCYSTAEELTDLSIRNRYLVFRLLIHDATVKVDERVFTLSSRSHSTSLRPRHISYSWSTMAQVASIGVFEMGFSDGGGDTWRIQHPTEKVFSEPFPRKNRLESFLYIETFR